VRDLDAAFVHFAEQSVEAVSIAPDTLFLSGRDRLIELAAQFALPTMYFSVTFVGPGGLMSYDANFADSFHQAGVYVGRILKGENPADLPVIQPTKYEFVINLKTAKTLGLTIPANLLAVADEVIE